MPASCLLVCSTWASNAALASQRAMDTRLRLVNAGQRWSGGHNGEGYRAVEHLRRRARSPFGVGNVGVGDVGGHIHPKEQIGGIKRSLTGLAAAASNRAVRRTALPRLDGHTRRTYPLDHPSAELNVGGKLALSLDTQTLTLCSAVAPHEELSVSPRAVRRRCSVWWRSMVVRRMWLLACLRLQARGARR